MFEVFIVDWARSVCGCKSTAHVQVACRRSVDARHGTMRGTLGVHTATAASWLSGCMWNPSNLRKTSFTPLLIFLLSRMSGFLWSGFFGIFGLVVPGILGQALPLFLLKFSMLGVAYAW